MIIREFTPADTPRVVAMALRFIEETSYKAFPSTPERLEALIDQVMQLGTIIVAEVQGEVVGMLALVAVPHPWTLEEYVDEIAWWVEPEYRSGTAGPRLIVAAEEWTTRKGLTSLKMVAPAGSRVGTFYERRGYVAVETAYLKRF
jgi:GNAT superfamily N-acetyltransferase